MSCLKGISSLDRCEILALTNSLSLALSEGLSVDDINALGNLFATIGSVMMTFGSLNANQNAGNNTTKHCQ